MFLRKQPLQWLLLQPPYFSPAIYCDAHLFLKKNKVRALSFIKIEETEITS
jgi:hypothetical protein